MLEDVFLILLIILINCVNLILILKRKNEILSSCLFIINYLLNFVWICLLLDFKYKIIISTSTFLLLVLEVIKLRNIVKTNRLETERINSLLQAFYA